MELRHLRYFVVTAELEHFGRAAQRLNIVQSALSKQIRELENELAVPLFERLARGVRLTPAGRAFLADARMLLQSAEHSARRARDVAAGRAGRLRIGFVDTAIYHSVLPQTFHAFRQNFPAVQIELVQQPSLVQGELLEAGELDLAFVFHRPLRLATIAHLPVATEPIVLAVPSSHPLVQRTRVRLVDLRDESFVWIPRSVSPPFYDSIFAACAAKGFEPRIVQEARTDLTILSLVAAGAGVSFCVASAENRKPREVTLVKISDLRVSVRLEAVWRTDRGNPALPEFISVLQRRLLNRS